MFMAGKLKTEEFVVDDSNTDQFLSHLAAVGQTHLPKGMASVTDDSEEGEVLWWLKRLRRVVLRKWNIRWGEYEHFASLYAKPLGNGQVLLWFEVWKNSEVVTAWVKALRDEIVRREREAGLSVPTPLRAVGRNGHTAESEPAEGADGELKLPSEEVMRQYYPDYCESTAREILKSLPAAWLNYQAEGGRWGPKWLSGLMALESRTIGRYLSAFKKAGIKKYKGILLP